MFPCRFAGALMGLTAVVAGSSLPTSRAADHAPDWTRAHLRKPMTAAETRAFMKRLAQFVYDHHLRQDRGSAMRGMIYEYVDMRRTGQFDQFVQGEGLDTMHDGAWFAAAMVNAYRATGDAFYKEILTRWQLPFYCKMLNHSDALFSTQRNDARPGAAPFNKEHALQQGEKGFVPYFWDDGGSVSLERRREKNPLGIRPCTDLLAGKPNPKFLLHGYSHGSSNHLAQDLGVMLELSWLLLHNAPDEADRKLAAEVAEAAQNLYACRMRHHGHIPMCDAAAALATGQAKLLQHVPDLSTAATWTPANHYLRALYDFKPGQRLALPGFADDQQYRYYFGIAKHGGHLPKALAFRTVYDAYTEPLLYRYYSDDAPVPAGINRFDLHPYYAKDGRLEDYRSDRKGPFGKARPTGSRMGPQNMICCGWALQVLSAYPGLWEERYTRHFSKDLRVYLTDVVPGGKPSNCKGAEINVGGLPLTLGSLRGALQLRIGTRLGQEATVKVFGKPDAMGSHVLITVTRKGEITVVNERGECVRGVSTGGGSGVFLQIPFTIAKAQKPWANGVEHGRYSIQVADLVRNFYLASPESQVQAELQHELAGGLRTWEAIFNVKGYIPTGMGAGADWDHFSDSGGYAHLISAASQWLLYLDGRSDWEMQQIPSFPSRRGP